jgi:hypothetical protein
VIEAHPHMHVSQLLVCVFLADCLNKVKKKKLFFCPEKDDRQRMEISVVRILGRSLNRGVSKSNTCLFQFVF